MVDENSSFGELFAALSKVTSAFEDKHGELVLTDEFEFPMTINKILTQGARPRSDHKVGTLVQIRPVAAEYKKKTYLGIYLGDLLLGHDLYVGPKSKTLFINKHNNPAIFVPELKAVIWGNASWWGRIKSEEQLKQITDQDIEDVWYVKLLRQQLEEKEVTGSEKENEDQGQGGRPGSQEEEAGES